ncbi:glycosyltransferase family protein [Microbacterium marinilacus]|uniref:Glycosyltransferase n=1 Tax=Microbacterium marinilacus TaxID=415209 RepID=A0ABP7B9B9_9MICO|nr:glycosyl transferase family 28 [Microbacterium marinilacus]MBY0687152.1 glycosyl transferase family 28 [Microbacterium marinilacus]
MTIRIVLYSHDSVGLGHIRRNLALAHALTEGLHAELDEPVTGLLVAGRPEATEFPAPPGWDWLILPGVRHSSGGYAARTLDVELGALTALRGRAFAATLTALEPDLVIIDRHPLGVDRELEHALHQLRARRPGCAVVLGLRDVLDAPDVARAEWRAAGGARNLRQLFDAVWVFGDPRVHDAVTSGELPPRLRGLARHTGYLSTGRAVGAERSAAEPFVLTTVGGGADGLQLALAAAAAEVPEGHAHVVVTGPQMPPADHAAVTAAARPGTRVVHRVADVLALAQRAAAVVCMGGYNTVSEVMSTATPALVVPRIARRSEQRIRAAALARAGAVDTALPGDIDAETIGAWFSARVGTRVARSGIDLAGLSEVPRLAAELVGQARDGGERVAI